MRRRMKDSGFEFQTPILDGLPRRVGARDFLVPSRLHPGKFYALPHGAAAVQAADDDGGFDRYFQIAPVSATRIRAPTFRRASSTQLDVEMSFVEQEDVFVDDGAGDHRRLRGVRRGKTVTRNCRAFPMPRRWRSTAPTSRTCAT